MTNIEPLAPSFDRSQFILDELRKNVRHGLIAEQVAPAVIPRMTATEIIERSRTQAAKEAEVWRKVFDPIVQRTFDMIMDNLEKE